MPPTLTEKLFRRKAVVVMEAETGSETGKSELSRSIGLFQLSMFGIGATIGTGIFFVLSEAVPIAGPAVIWSFVIAGWSRARPRSATRSWPELARATHTQDASYLDVIHTSEGEWNPTDYAYHLTRRARGLPLWFSLAVYGLGAHRKAVEAAVQLARDTAALIKTRPYLELIREPDLGVVLFRRLGWKGEDYDAWAEALLAEGAAFIPPTKWEGEPVGRFAFLHPHTPMELVQEILDRTA